MSGSRGAMFVLAGFAALLLVIAVFSGWQGANRLSDRSNDAAKVEAVAREFVQAYGSFDYREPWKNREALRALTTSEATVLETDPVGIGQHRVATIQIVGAYASALSVDSAAVSVTAEQRRRSRDPQSGKFIEEHVRQQINCRLVRDGNRWLVGEFRLVFEEPLNSGG